MKINNIKTINNFSPAILVIWAICATFLFGSATMALADTNLSNTVFLPLKINAGQNKSQLIKDADGELGAILKTKGVHLIPRLQVEKKARLQKPMATIF